MTWQTLLDIKRENRVLEEAAKKAGPIACPNCGNVLDIHGRTKVRNCPTGDFRWRP